MYLIYIHLVKMKKSIIIANVKKLEKKMKQNLSFVWHACSPNLMPI